MEEYVLGADIGSGSVKLTLLSRAGEVAATCGCEYPTQYPQVGWAEQDPEAWCRAFASALAELLQKTGVAPRQIAALAPDAATHTAVLLDGENRPVAPAVLWTDQRSAQEAAWLREHCMEVIRREALNTPTTVWTLPQLLWVRKHRPEQWARTRRLVFAKDYLRYRLTGTLATDTIDAMGSMFYDAVNERWSEELCAVGGIDPAWLPRLCRPTDLAGRVTPEAAREFGLAAGTPVYTGTSDTVMEVLAAGNVAAGHSTVKLATAGRICVVTDSAHASPFLFNYRHVVPGLWYPGTATSSCAASFRWFRDTLGHAPFDELDEGAAQIAPGSEGLMFHPHLQGELTPYNDPALRASYIGISARHTTAHFTRATLEGIAYSLRDCMDTVRGEGMRMTRVRLIGGGAKSALWRQIMADVLGMRLEKVETDDSSFGTAMLAAVALGWYSGFAKAAEACVRISGVTEPNEQNHALYEREFLRYRLVHEALAPLDHAAAQAAKA